MSAPARGAVAARWVAVPGGGRLAVTERGVGEPVVLLHGFAMDGRMWADAVDVLTARFRTVVVDLRGFGRSTPQVPDAGHGDDVLAVLDRLGVAAAHLVGLSLGANVALDLALRRPGAVRRLVLASPGLPGHRWHTPRPPDEVAAAGRARGRTAAHDLWRDHPLLDPVRARPRAWALMQAMIEDVDASTWRGQTARPLAEAASRLADVAAPTLVVNGERDLPGYLEIGERIAREVPGATRRVVPGAGHVVNLEEPDAVTGLVSAFLNGSAPVGPAERQES